MATDSKNFQNVQNNEWLKSENKVNLKSAYFDIEKCVKIWFIIGILTFKWELRESSSYK